jgi:UrcA family protein
MRHRVLKTVVLASFVALGLPSLAMAASPSQFGEGSIQVEYGDLNINTAAGAKALYKRLQKAAEEGCYLRPYRELGSIRLYNESRSCYKEKLSAVVERINSDELTKIHATS